jgi:hypothetical protein
MITAEFKENDICTELHLHNKDSNNQIGIFWLVEDVSASNTM